MENENLPWTTFFLNFLQDAVRAFFGGKILTVYVTVPGNCDLFWSFFWLVKHVNIDTYFV